MSSSVRSFFRSKKSNINPSQNSEQTIFQRSIPPSNSLLHDVNEWITSINTRQKSMNTSCCIGEDKKDEEKNTPTKAPRMIKETTGHMQTLADPMEASDHKINHIPQQSAPKVEINDDLKDLFGKKEITKAMINQLAQRALTASMNSNNDDPPRLCTKKHVRN
jgi:hypothetical protein